MDLLELDTLGLYFGDPYIINENISVLQPTIGDISKYGEKLLQPYPHDHGYKF